MKRTVTVMTLVVALALGMMAPAMANQGKGQGQDPDRAERGNSLISRSEAVADLTVEAQVADPTAANFEEEFVYYVVRFDEVNYDQWVYREPTRLEDNHVSGAGSSSAFWFGVSGPDGDGIQHEIVHDGTVWIYHVNEDGTAEHVKAVFDDGVLLHVNGVEPADL